MRLLPQPAARGPGSRTTAPTRYIDAGELSCIPHRSRTLAAPRPCRAGEARFQSRRRVRSADQAPRNISASLTTAYIKDRMGFYTIHGNTVLPVLVVEQPDRNYRHRHRHVGEAHGAWREVGIELCPGRLDAAEQRVALGTR